MPDYNWIKLRAVVYRPVYQVDDKIVLVTVIAVGKRDTGLTYLAARKQTKK